jgi:hypothetical protein
MRLSNPKWWKATGFVALMLALALAAGCSRQPSLQASDENANQSLPFEQASDKTGLSPTASLMPAAIPAGTPITIRLQSAVSSATSQSGEAFGAVLDEPIVIDGHTVVQRGAAVTGRVVAAKASGRLQDPGYLRLTLATISINGKSLSVQTSSIFDKGGSHEKHNVAMIGSTGAAYATGKKDVGFSAERRLTFRLTQPLPLQG